MANYQNGKIYTIRSPNTEKFYIGATIQPLYKRFGEHKKLKFNKSNSKEILAFGDAFIELLEVFPCNSKIELSKREGELIRLHRDKCVNKYIAGRTQKEWVKDNQEHVKAYKKQNYEENKESIAQKYNGYYQINKEKLKEKMKEYHINNKDKSAEQSKIYNREHKEQIAEYHKQYRKDNQERLKEQNRLAHQKRQIKKKVKAQEETQVIYQE